MYKEEEITTSITHMSYLEAKAERDEDIYAALNSRDSEKLFQLAGIVKEEGDDEAAEQLLALAKQIEKDEWAYDESKNN